MEQEIEYRGYLAWPEEGFVGGTDRIRRPDGSWRYSPPSIVGTHWMWRIGKRDENGVLEVVASVYSEDQARETIDELLAKEKDTD